MEAQTATAIVSVVDEAIDRAKVIAERRGHELSGVWHQHKDHHNINRSNMCMKCFAYIIIRHDGKVTGPATNKNCK